MELTPAERKRRSQAMQQMWANPETRQKLLAASRRPRPTRGEHAAQLRQAREKAALERRKRSLAERLGQQATADTDLRPIRRALDTIRPLLDAYDYAAYEDRYTDLKVQVIDLRQLRQEQRRAEREAQWASA